MNKFNQLLSLTVLLSVMITLSACGTAKPNVNDNMNLPLINKQPSDSKPEETNKKVDVGDLSIEENPGVLEEVQIKKEVSDNKPLAPAHQPNLISQYKGAIIQTSEGDIEVKLYNSETPITANNFMYLAELGFYNGTLFHRVMKDFMIQGGDPNSKDENWAIHGTGGPGYKFIDESNDKKLVAGSLAMANSGINTNGSQFFIVTAESTPWLDGAHTNFGEVVSGMDIVRKIEAATVDGTHPVADIIIKNIKLVK